MANYGPLFRDIMDFHNTIQSFTVLFDFQEFFKASIDLADLIGMYIALSRIPGRGHSKCLTAGIGWGTAELVLSRFLTIWVGAKGIEFNWRYIQMSFDANISMVRIADVTPSLF